MTSDSMSTRPRIKTPRMSPTAPGLRAIASAAEPIARPCPMAPPAAAMARANPAVMMDHCTKPLLAASAAASWANTGDATPRTRNASITDSRERRVLTKPPQTEQLLWVGSDSLHGGGHPEGGYTHQDAHRVELQAEHHNVGCQGEYSMPCE